MDDNSLSNKNDEATASVEHSAGAEEEAVPKNENGNDDVVEDDKLDDDNASVPYATESEDDNSINFPEPPPVLSWRLDPSESFSDWTIRIRKDDDDSIIFRSFHVHTNILAVGPRRCEYFVALFRNRYEESQTRSSTIALPSPCVDVFPLFLDFVYSTTTETLLNTQNVVALRYLAKFFLNSLLRQKIALFMRQDMHEEEELSCQLERLAVYYSNATAFGDEKVLGLVTAKLLSHLTQLTLCPKLLEQMEPRYFLELLKKSKQTDPSMSIVIWKYYSIHRDALSRDTLEQATANVPEIHVTAALPFLKWQAEWNDDDTITDLQDRCLDAIAKHHGHDVLGHCQEFEAVLSKDLMVALLKKAMTVSKQEFEASTQRQREEWRWSHKRRMKRQLCRFRKQHNHELQECKRSCAQYKKSLRQFKRIPAEQEQDYTVQPQPVANVVYQSSGCGILYKKRDRPPGGPWYPVFYQDTNHQEESSDDDDSDSSSESSSRSSFWGGGSSDSSDFSSLISGGSNEIDDDSESSDDDSMSYDSDLYSDD